MRYWCGSSLQLRTRRIRRYFISTAEFTVLKHWALRYLLYSVILFVQERDILIIGYKLNSVSVDAKYFKAHAKELF